MISRKGHFNEDDKIGTQSSTNDRAQNLQILTANLLLKYLFSFPIVLENKKKSYLDEKALTSFCRNEIVCFWDPWGL